MLSPRELFDAQGFPSNYVIAPSFGGVTLSQRAQQKLVGNSVSPPVAEALLRANLPASFARAAQITNRPTTLNISSIPVTK